jgi:sarcosine oxidase subunit beta
MPGVIVIGAGISGAATAYELATAGLSVVIVDRYGPVAMASGWTLAGVRQSGRDPAELPLAKAAVDIWGSLAERLEVPIHYVRRGNLRLARTQAEFDVVSAIVAEQSAAGLGIELLASNAAVRALAPAIAETVIGASYCPTDGHADPKATVEAYLGAATRAGAVVRFAERVVSIDVEGGKVIGVTTDKGRIAAKCGVLLGGNPEETEQGGAVRCRGRVVHLNHRPPPCSARCRTGSLRARKAGRRAQRTWRAAPSMSACRASAALPLAPDLA